MNRYTESDELVNLQIRYRHATLPIEPPVPVVELPDGSHECAAPRDWERWLGTLALPMQSTGEARWEPEQALPRRHPIVRYALVACIWPVAFHSGVIAGLVGRWWS